MFQIVLVHRYEDTKTCLGETSDEAKTLAKRVFKKHPNYDGCFYPDY